VLIVIYRIMEDGTIMSAFFQFVFRREFKYCEEEKEGKKPSRAECNGNFSKGNVSPLLYVK